MIIHTNQLDRWQEYRDLRIRALRDIPQAFLDDPENAENWPAEEWQKRMENMYFAEEEGKWVGMIGSYQEPKSKLQHIANVVSFFVLPESRGQGIGKALLSRVIEDAKKKKTIKKLKPKKLNLKKTPKKALKKTRHLLQTTIQQLKLL